MATTTAVTSDACDRKGDVCDIWYPTDLGSDRISGTVGGFRHPVIVFANGTALTVPAEKNAFFLRHLASWGFIVIRSRDGATGQGETVIDTANYIIGLGRKSGSIFEGKVDAENVGLTGHSQGGATAVLLFSRGNSPFKTFVPIETPIRPFCAIANCLIDPGALPRVSQGSIFYIGGGMDLVSSEPTNLGYYLPTADRVDKVLGIVANGSHTEIEGDPTCAGATKGTCNIGVYPLLGFPTAWFMWKLQNAAMVRMRSQRAASYLTLRQTGSGCEVTSDDDGSLPCRPSAADVVSVALRDRLHRRGRFPVTSS